MFGLNKLRHELKSLAETSFKAAQTASINKQLNAITYYPNYNNAQLTDQYVTSDQVYSVVSKIAETSALVPVYTYAKTEEKAFKKLKDLTNRQFYTTKGIFDIQVMQTKALADPKTDKLEQLLEKPNDYQSKVDFLTAAYTFFLLNGECIIWIERLEETANAGLPYQLHIFPPGNVTITVTQDFPQEIVGYNLSINGRIILKNVPPEDIIHWKKINTQVSLSGIQFRGLSPLQSATNLTARLTEADLRSLNQLKNGSLPGIVYDKSIGADELDQPVFDAQKKAFYDFTTNINNHGAPFFVGSEKGFIQTGLSAADLKLIELQNIDFKRLCNIYKVSIILFNSDVAATESNVREQIKQMYTSACLPMVYSFMSILNKTLVPLYDGVDFINCDISSISELQDDIKLMLQAFSYLPVSLSGNELRKLVNYEPIELPWMDQPLIKQGYTFYDDVSLPPVDPSLLDTGL